MMYSQLRAQIERITPLTDAEFDYVAGHFTSKRLRKHQFLIQEGEAVLHDYYVVNGCLKACLPDAEGREYILQFALEDWWITDYQAYFRQTPATLYVDCIEPGDVLCLSLHDREKLCAELHKIEHFFRRRSNNGYVALQQRILSLLTSSAAERYDQLLAASPQLFQRVPKKLIAAYLGVSRETLSRLSRSR
jgi:CRP-like cAMP-binding protein